MMLPPVRASSSVSVVNVANYPWLSQGAFASYSYATLGGPPAHVTPNGVVLLDIRPVTPNGTALPAAKGAANFTWTVISRTAELASLNITFESSGCQYSQMEVESHSPCTQYTFRKSVDAVVNISSGETYVDNQPQGRINFWAPPLLVQGQLYLGSMFVSGSRVDSLGNLSASPRADFGNSIDVSGADVPPPYDTYSVNPTTLGFGEAYRYAWLNSSGVNLNNPNQITGLGPSGFYDYYNGLALYLSGPEYPIQQTVCSIRSGMLENCQYVAFATTLGEFFYTGVGSFVLTTTNIPLVPTESQSQPGQAGSSILYFVVGMIVVVAVAATLVFANRRRFKG